MLAIDVPTDTTNGALLPGLRPQCCSALKPGPFTQTLVSSWGQSRQNPDRWVAHDFGSLPFAWQAKVAGLSLWAGRSILIPDSRNPSRVAEG